MPIFLERFVLPILAAFIGIIVINSIKLDLQQRMSLSICVICLAYFVSHTLQRNKPSTIGPPPLVVQGAHQAGVAATSGDNSPAVTGNGNAINYDAAAPVKNRSTPTEKGKP